MKEEQNSVEPKLEGLDVLNDYSLFIYAFRSTATRISYLRRLKRFFDFLDLKRDAAMEERYNYFVKQGRNDIEWAFSSIIRFIQFEKQRVEKREITGGTLRNSFKTIKLLCDVADIHIPWKKIIRGLPRGKKYADDRAPTLEEIRKIVEYPDRRIKPIVYTVASSGFRLGSWGHLKWGHIRPMIRNNDVIAAKIIVYGGDDEEYFSFITPEAYYAIKDWMDYRRECGEVINEDSCVIRNLWDSTSPKAKGSINNPKPLSSEGVKQLMQRTLFSQGLRKKLDGGKKRHEFQANHSFRKWFKTRCEMAGMKPINVEVLMGHSTGISDAYYRATESELLEDYLKAIDFLTINDNHILERKFSEMEQTRVSDIGKLNIKLQEKSIEIENLQRNDSRKNDAIAALSDKLQELMSEVEAFKKRG